jgi:plastocyanin
LGINHFRGKGDGNIVLRVWNERKRAVGTVGRGIAGLSALALVVAAPALGSARHAVAAKPKTAAVTVINVTAGKPTELAFKLSKFSNIPLGKIEFKVVDGGVAFHDFKFCTTPTTTNAKNSCVGSATKVLHPKQTATLTVTVKKVGKYEFLCTVTGHAAAGMKGLLGVGVPVTAAAEVAAAKPSSTSASTSLPQATGSSAGSTTGTTGGTPVGGGGGVAQPDNSADSACPTGTIKTNGNADGDGDEAGDPTDGDGCV